MIINKIILNNIGPYINDNIFDLVTNNKKNIILIGGKNGSGKTTFLKSIKFGLFGSYALGYKGDSKKYNDEIMNLINTEKNRNKSSIELHVSIIEDSKQKEYIIKREWLLSGGELEEEVSVVSGEFELDKYSVIEFFERIKSFTSPQLINSTIFDGEKIGNIIQNDEIQKFLEETFNAIFNVNMLNQLNIDLLSYLEKRSNENLSGKELYSFSLLSEANLLKTNSKKIEAEISALNSKLNDLNYKKKELQKKFNNLGGLTKSKIEVLIEEMNSISKNTEQRNKKFKSIIENDSCFILNSEMLKSGFNQIKNELPLYYLNQLNKIKEYLNSEDENLSNILNSKLKNNIRIIHDIGEFDNEKMKEIINVYNDKLKFVKNYLEIKDEEADRLNKFKNQIEAQDQIDEFENILSEINTINDSISYLQQEINIKAKKQKDITEKFNKTYSNLNYINNEIRKKSTHDRSFSIATNAIEVNNHFINYLKASKLKEVSNVTTEIFNETIRKHEYVSKIEIDSEYRISLFDRFGSVMKLKTLSAGEIQLLISSIIWAMFKVSGRKETFVFDTPLARLDIENRLSFINNIIKTISEQVIILSTDSEFIGQNYETVKPNISRSYRLEYINKKKITKIKKGYFD